MQPTSIRDRLSGPSTRRAGAASSGGERSGGAVPEHRRAASGAWPAWLAAVVGVPLLLAAVALLWPGRQLDDDLRQRSAAALAAAGLPGVDVTVAGRDVALRGVPAGAEADAAAAVGAVPGVRSARVEGPPGPAASAPPGTAAGSARGREDQGLPDAERQRLTAELAAVLGSAPILFRADSAALTEGSAAAVAEVAALLRAAPAARVELEGHVADTPGSPDIAQALSDQRAAVVADALVAAGVDRGRLTTVGRADREPLGSRAASRRVEIRIR
jgi:outer membrane protein OmpA-like peptidoglycan-associated protein